jgi:hypothetical protein
VRDQDRLRLYSGEAIAQCDMVFGTTYFADYTILRDQVVVRDDKASALDVFDRASCKRIATVPIPVGYKSGPIPVRGATLMTCVDEDNRTSVPLSILDSSTTIPGPRPFAPQGCTVKGAGTHQPTRYGTASDADLPSIRSRRTHRFTAQSG